MNLIAVSGSDKTEWAYHSRWERDTCHCHKGHESVLSNTFGNGNRAALILASTSSSPIIWRHLLLRSRVYTRKITSRGANIAAVHQGKRLHRGTFRLISSCSWTMWTPARHCLYSWNRLQLVFLRRHSDYGECACFGFYLGRWGQWCQSWKAIGGRLT